MAKRIVRPLIDTHPELEKHLVDRDLGKEKGKGYPKLVEWNCPNRICGKTHLMRIPDKIRRGNKCKFCRPRKIKTGMDYIQRTIKRRLVKAVQKAGCDHCTTCEGVFRKEKMAKGVARICKPCASRRHVLYVQAHPEYVRVRNATRARRCRNSTGTFDQKDWKSRLDYYGGKCVYCGTGDNITIEHRIPISRGGTT